MLLSYSGCYRPGGKMILAAQSMTDGFCLSGKSGITSIPFLSALIFT